jgi:hypothetical protein
MTQLLCAYTLALALSGWLVIRAGRIWEDARMILLVVLLMFTALSTSYDDLCLKTPAAGAFHLAIGFAFCCAVTEFILYSLGMKLPLRYRAPFYLQLALLFAFPACLGRLSVIGHDTAMCLGVLSFPVAAGTGLLTLLPAAMGAPEHDNGTPWPWPFYPWSIFVFVAVADGIRAWMLSVSFSPAGGVAPAFLPYFLCPVLLAILILGLELGLRARSRATQHIALFAMFGVIWLSFPGNQVNSAQQLVLTLLEHSLAGPPVLVTTAVSVIAIYGMFRRAAGSEFVAIVALSLLGCLDLNTRSPHYLGPPNSFIWFALALWQFSHGLWIRNTWRLAFGGIAAIIVFGKATDDHWIFAHNAFWAFQIAAVWCALLPLYCRDGLANYLRDTACFWMPAITTYLTVVHPDSWFQTPEWAPAVVATTTALLCLVYWARFRIRWYLLSAGWSGTLASVLFAKVMFHMITDAQLRQGLTWYVAGYAVLGAGLILSLWKARSIQRAWAWLQHQVERPPNGDASA